MWPVLVILAIFFLVMLWPFVLILIGIIILYFTWPRKEHHCDYYNISQGYCHEKFYSNWAKTAHMKTCPVLLKNKKEAQERAQERENKERQEKQRKWKEQERERNLIEKWRKNWKTQTKWNFSEEEFWKIQKDIDERKENATKDLEAEIKKLEEERHKATEKLWDKYYATTSESLAEELSEKAFEIEEEFDDKIFELEERILDLEEEEFGEEERRLWDLKLQGNDEYRKAKEAYEKAKEDWKKATGKEWRDNNWKRNWDEAFDGIFGKKINIEECYETLGLDANTTFEQVKKRFRELALKFHPDKAQDKKSAEEKFKKIYEAYETIKMNQIGGVKA